MGWLAILFTYAVGVSLALVLVILNRRRESASLTALRSIDTAQLGMRERIEVLLAIAKVEHAQIPWFERAVSTLGVVAFVAAAIGIIAQTFEVSTEARKVEALSGEVESQRRALGRAHRMLRQTADSIIAQTRIEARAPTEDEREILVERREMLRHVDNPSKSECDELLRLGLGLRDGSSVVRTIASCPNVLSGANDADKVATASYLYLTGAESGAREVLKTIALTRGSPSLYRSEVLALSAALEPERLKEWVQAYAALTRLDEARASARLQIEIEKLRQDKAAVERGG
jgi:hypothetical protein